MLKLEKIPNSYAKTEKFQPRQQQNNKILFEQLKFWRCPRAQHNNRYSGGNKKASLKSTQ